MVYFNILPYVVLTIGVQSQACQTALRLRILSCGVSNARSERILLLLERASASSRSTHSNPARFGAVSTTEKREHEPGGGRRGAGDACGHTCTGCRQSGAAAAVAAAAATARMCAVKQAKLLALRARTLRSRAHSGVVFMACTAIR